MSTDQTHLPPHRLTHYFLPALPALRLMYSPSYLTPFPLYTSGGRLLLMNAATSPTVCLFVPFTDIFVFASTDNVIHAGGTIRTG